MREFNTFGPVYPQQHYHVNRVAVKAALRDKIERGRYFTLNAGRQTGKTTLFREVMAELEQTGDYFGVLFDCGSLKGLHSKRLYAVLGEELRPRSEQLSVPLEAALRDHASFVQWLRRVVRQRQQKGVLILDEFDALPETVLMNLLSLFRAMYLARTDSAYGALWSIVLVGVRTIPSLLHGSQSPFNIADQFTVPYFTPAETTDLLTQHTHETSQPIAPAVLEGVVRETEGQPFLVNRLGQLLTQDLVRDHQQTIVAKDFEAALAQLLYENNAHFPSIIAKAQPHRERLLPMLFYWAEEGNVRDPDIAELLMFGVLRLLPNQFGQPTARLANPIYRLVLLLTFAPKLEPPPPRRDLYRYWVDGVLDFDALMDSFSAFMREHGVRLLKSKVTDRPLEIGGQYLLLSYLNAALGMMGGYVTLESLVGTGEVDILAFCRGQRFIVETKIWYGLAAFEKGKQQLVDYLRAAGLPKGYLVVFDERAEANPLLAAQGATFELQVADKQLRVYIIAVQR